ncbi:MAG: beta-glucosidase [Candidatus Omnitrophota bacterium]|jgi:beta-glucosidase
MSDKQAKFPQGFLWGAATSSHQIEGNNRFNDWWDWEHQGKTGDVSGNACDSYNRYTEDFDIIKSLNHNAHRFSIEWSRIEPSEGAWSDKALDHYRQLIRALRERGIEPIVTLHHFTNPMWVSEAGGWANKQFPVWFERYVDRVVKALGSEVKYWMTFNEQNVMVYKGCIEGQWPPGKQSIRLAWASTRHLVKAHQAAYLRIHEYYQKFGWKKPKVGLAHHFLCAQPVNARSWSHRFVAWVRRYCNNHLFIDWINGEGLFYAWVDKKKYIDFIGVNYYMRELIRPTKKGRWLMRAAGEVATDDERYIKAEKNDLEWEVYPDGLYDNLMEVWKRYRIPLMVTENGICTHDEGQRQNFIRQHVRRVHNALADGCLILGYIHWSLLDNFEWSIGYGPKFGLCSIDPKTQDRTIKSAAQYYSKICQQNALLDD